MKTIGGLPIVKDTNAKYPFTGNIQNETDTLDGTPVVREIYGDILMNLYRLLVLTGITPTETEDNNDTQFQVVEALKKLPNQINDINHVLTLDGDVWTLPLDLAYLPNKFVCFAQVTDNYNSLETYKLRGTGDIELPFSSLGFNASEEVIIIIDTDGVKAYSLNKLIEVEDTVFTSLGSPIAFNDTNIMYYKENGYLMTDLPSVQEVQQAIRVDASDGTLVLNDIFLRNNELICVVFRPSDDNYFIYGVSLDLSSIVLNITFAAGNTYLPYFYINLDGELFITNNSNGSLNDYDIDKYERNISGVFIFVSTTPIDATFVKTTNAVIENGFLYTFITGQLNKFNLTTGVKTEIMFLPSVNGQLFRFNGEVYFTTGEVAKKWVLT